MYKALTIDFWIPEILSEDIEGFLKDLNERQGILADCWQEEIRNILNCYEEDFSEEQVEILRNYYCKGGIYESDN